MTIDTLTGVTQTSVFVTWTDSAPTAATTYRVSHRATGATSWTVDLNTNATRATIQNLKAGTDYDVRVQILGTSVSSIIQVTTATAGTAPGPIGTLNITNVTATSVLLTWTAPATGTAPLAYQAQQAPAGPTPTWVNVGAPQATLTETISGLSPSTPYQFRVQVSNATGVNFSPAFPATTLAQAPSAPLNVTATQVGTTSLQLNWDPPAQGSTPFTYNIMYRTPSGVGSFVPLGTVGTQAVRVADVVEKFGVVTFSQSGGTNTWGSSPSDYNTASVINALNWMTNSSGFALLGMEYHYAGRESLQIPWLQAMVTAIPGTRWCVRGGGNSTNADMPSIITMLNTAGTGINWVGSTNEPNNGGQGVIPVTETMAAQLTLLNGAGLSKCVSASPIFGLPDVTTLPASYWGSSINQLKTEISYGDVHIYPFASPNQDNTMRTIHTGLGANGLYGHPLAALEFHPTLFTSLPGVVNGGPQDGYFLLQALRMAAQFGWLGLWYFALFDYANIYTCGLFPSNNSNNPRSSAWAIRALCTVTGDTGVTKRTFTPGSLAYSVSQLPGPMDSGSSDSGGHQFLMESSDGRFFIWLENGRNALGGAATPVTISFPSPPTKLQEFNISLGTSLSVTPVQTLLSPNTSSIVSQLDASVRIIAITP